MMRWLRYLVVLAIALVLSPAPSANSSPLLRQWNDLPYRTVDGVTLRLNVSSPDAGTFPAVVWVHGGSWQTGDKDIQKYRDRSDAMAADGFVVFNVNFRLACSDPLNPLCGYHFPAPIEDIEAAVQWIQANGTAYGWNGQKIGIAGGSSGGNLGAEVAMRGNVLISAVVAYSGTMDMVDFLPGSEQERTNYIGCSYNICPSLWADASPYKHATPGDPPTWMSNSSGDPAVPPSDSRTMARTLRALVPPVPYERHLIKNSRCHGLGCLTRDPTLWPDSLSWLHQWLDAA